MKPEVNILNFYERQYQVRRYRSMVSDPSNLLFVDKEYQDPRSTDSSSTVVLDKEPLPGAGPIQE